MYVVEKNDILVHVEPAGKCQTGEKFGVDKDMV